MRVQSQYPKGTNTHRLGRLISLIGVVVVLLLRLGLVLLLMYLLHGLRVEGAGRLSVGIHRLRVSIGDLLLSYSSVIYLYLRSITLKWADCIICIFRVNDAVTGDSAEEM